MSERPKKYLNGNGNIVASPGVRVPPHSKEAEQAVLGAMMLERDVADEVIASLIPEHFYHANHGEIFRAAMLIRKRGEPVDIVTLNEQLRKAGTLLDVGGSYYLAELNRLTPSAANAKFHAKIILEGAIKRRIISEASGLLEAAYEEGTDAIELLDSAGRTINELVEGRMVKGPRHISAVLTSLTAEVRRLATLKPGEVPGVGTGIFDFDRKTGGLLPSNLYVWAARPGMGKTGFLVCAAQYAASVQGQAAGIISLEMSDVQLIARAIASRSKVKALKFRDGGFEGDDIPSIERAIFEATGLPIFIDDSPGLTVEQIKTRARLLHRKHKIEILFVDYLQLVSDDTQRGTKAAEVTAISRGLKNLAKELNIPVVALAQLNRALESRVDRRPQLSDLKESGGIEEAADQVMFIHRPEYYGIDVDEDGQSTAGIAELIIRKQRNGPTGTVKCRFVADLVHFEDLWRQGESALKTPWEQAREF